MTQRSNTMEMGIRPLKTKLTPKQDKLITPNFPSIKLIEGERKKMRTRQHKRSEEKKKIPQPQGMLMGLALEYVIVTIRGGLPVADHAESGGRMLFAVESIAYVVFIEKPGKQHKVAEIHGH